MHYFIGIPLLAISIIVAAIYIRKWYVVNCKYDKKAFALGTAQYNVSELCIKNKTLHGRIEELEIGIEKEYNVTVRKEFTNILCDFSPSELSYISNILIRKSNLSNTAAELRYHLNVIDKLKWILDKVDKNFENKSLKLSSIRDVMTFNDNGFIWETDRLKALENDSE